jgi:hypothetical protein
LERSVEVGVRLERVGEVWRAVESSLIEHDDPLLIHDCGRDVSEMGPVFSFTAKLKVKGEKRKRKERKGEYLSHTCYQ